LEEGFAKIDDGTRTVFFFDDFLGRIELNRQSLLQCESALATFVNRVRKSKNARIILTTRAHIFEEARSISDYVDLIRSIRIPRPHALISQRGQRGAGGRVCDRAILRLPVGTRVVDFNSAHRVF
jgi:hypothetical protein